METKVACSPEEADFERHPSGELLKDWVVVDTVQSENMSENYDEVLTVEPKQKAYTYSLE